jgi:hypothetical protein
MTFVFVFDILLVQQQDEENLAAKIFLCIFSAQSFSVRFSHLRPGRAPATIAKFGLSKSL